MPATASSEHNLNSSSANSEAPFSDADLDLDIDTDVIPLDKRRHPLAMGLLWITMITSFPTVLIGVEWYRIGFSLQQVLICALFSCVLVLVFCSASAQLGTITGHTYGHLNRSVFGRWGARLTTFNLIAIFLVCYAFGAFCMADAISGLFNLHGEIGLIAAVFSFLMCLNNLWGFAGVVNFAKYFAAPCMIVWVIFTFIRALLAVSTSSVPILTHVSVSAPPASWTVALAAVASFVIGFSVWGNEADYWRHARPGIARTAIPLAVALCIGQIIFPATGWMVAHVSQVTDSARATAFMNEFSFGGIAIFALIVIGAQYFAAADSNLYAVVSAFDNLITLPKRLIVFGYAFVCALFAYWLSFGGMAKSIEIISTLNGILIPTCTTILLSEWALSKVIGKSQSRITASTVAMAELPAIRLPAMIAFTAGVTVGVVTAGLIPAFERWHIGIGCLNGWTTAALIYIPCRLVEHFLLNEKSAPAGPDRELDTTP
jgi:purine-cytosine permease-like protein